MPWIHAQVERDFDRLVELRRRVGLGEADRLVDAVELFAINGDRLCLLALERHDQPSTTSRPIARAEPSMMRVAASRSLAFKSFILVSAIAVSAERLILPAEILPGSFEPDLRFAAFLIRNDAGGVLVSNENDRSA